MFTVLAVKACCTRGLSGRDGAKGGVSCQPVVGIPDPQSRQTVAQDAR